MPDHQRALLTQAPLRSPMTLQQLIPDVDVLLALAEQELAEPLLTFAAQVMSARHDGMFHPGNSDMSYADNKNTAYLARKAEVDLAVAEAWNWLRVNGLVLPVPGTNGQNGWMTLSRRGKAIVANKTFRQFKEAAQFPQALLHPIIANKVWVALARGDLDEAVFAAFKAVEEAVRTAGGYGPTVVGLDLVRKAFHVTNGPLSDPGQPTPEREALVQLFAGAIGSYKNPHSHRTVSLNDPREAQEMVLLASHLLRIVEARKGRTAA